MHTSNRSRRVALALLLGTAIGLGDSSVAAQCPIQNVTFSSYGAGCTSVFTTAPTIAGKFDSTTCTIHLDISAYGGCCNTFLRNRIFVFGLTQTKLPMPWFGANCTLLASADLLVVQPVASGSTLSIALPSGTGSGSVYVQGAAHYFTTIGFANDYQLTAGLELKLQ